MKRIGEREKSGLILLWRAPLCREGGGGLAKVGLGYKARAFVAFLYVFFGRVYVWTVDSGSSGFCCFWGGA